MKSHPETIQEYVNRIAKAKGFNHEAIAKRAKKKGYKISAGYVNNIMHGYASNPSISLGKALAAGLGEPEDDVFAVLRGKQLAESQEFSQSFFASLWEDFKELSPAEQKKHTPLLEMVQREVQRLKSD